MAEEPPRQPPHAPEVDATETGATSPRLLAAAMAAAALGVAAHVVGKAARDALFLSTFSASALPPAFLATGIATGLVVALYLRLQARLTPRHVAPAVPAVVALSTAALWWWLRLRSPIAVAVLYGWLSIGGTLVISAFWGLLSELLDVRAARRSIAMLTVSGSVGGLVGAVATHRLLSHGTAQLLWLVAALHLGVAFLVHAMGRRAPTAPLTRPGPPNERTGLREGLSVIASDRYLRSVAAMVTFITIAGTLADFALKRSAAEWVPSEAELAELFATYHAVVGGVTLAVQLLLARPLLARRGLAATLVVLPALLVVAVSSFLLLPTLAAAILLRGGETTARNSFHRASYELLFVPVAPDRKRRAKPIMDTLVERAADGAGALVLLVLVALGWDATAPQILVGLFGIAAAATIPAVRRGYVSTLENELAERAEANEEIVLAAATDATTRHTLQLSSAGRAASPPAPRMTPDAPPPSPSSIRWDGRREALGAIVAALADDDRFEAAVEAMRPHVDDHAGALGDVLCDAATPPVLRKRLPRVLAHATTPRALPALYEALDDDHLAVRYHAARALRATASRSLPVDAARIWATLRREIASSLPLWEAGRRRDLHDDDSLRDVVDRHGAAGLRHVFNLLALVGDPEPVDLAYRAAFSDDVHARSVALEYLEHVLPADVRRPLWPYLGDESDAHAPVSGRAIAAVLEDLRQTRT